MANFKSIRRLAVRCRRVNVFVGRPNTGKSNILECLGLLSHVYYGNVKEFVRLESMVDLFYDRDTAEDVMVRVEFNSYTGTLVVHFEDGEFIGTYCIEHPSRGKRRSQVFSYNYLGQGSRVGLADLRFFKFYRFRVRESFPSEVSEFLLPPFGDNLLAVLMANKRVRGLVKDLLSEFGLRLVLRPVEKRIEVEKEFEDVVISYPYSLVSDTLQRIIFHLVAVEANRGSVIVFEEPEAHSFPYYTKFLAERIALDDSNQYFISTHNPYFLLSVLEKAPSSDVAVFVTYYRDFQTMVKELSEEEKRRLLDLELDAFFNLDLFVEGLT